jgi:hypothetical protein
MLSSSVLMMKSSDQSSTRSDAPRNPLAEKLASLGISLREGRGLLWRAAKREIERPTIQYWTTEIPSDPDERRHLIVPDARRRRQVHELILQIEAERGVAEPTGLPSKAWRVFAKAVAKHRARLDRRRSDVRQRIGLPPIAKAPRQSERASA